MPLAVLLVAAVALVVADGFILPGSALPTLSLLQSSTSTTSPARSALHAQIYMPDGSVVQDDSEDWKESRKPQTSSALLNHLNSPDMRGALAVLAAANKDIDITSIESVSVQDVTSSAIHIEALCVREDMHCVNVLVSIDFPEGSDTKNDKGVLDACGVLYQQANSKLEQKKIKTGTVVSFNAGRGFGFIAMDDDTGDVYVHHSNIRKDGFRELVEGERVEFKTDTDTKRGTGKIFAYDVTPLVVDEPIQAGPGHEKDNDRIPYDDATMLAYEESGKSVAYEDFKTQYESDVVDHVVSQRPPIDVSIPYDAAAVLAYADSDKSMAYEDFKAKYEADTIAMVISKKNERAAVTGTTPTRDMQAKGELRRKPQTATEKKEENTRLQVSLASKPQQDYSTIDLEERAFNILLDLGLISLTPDPDSPDYDTSMDDEFAPENVYID